MVVAMAGGGLVFRLLQVQMSCEKACRRSILSFTSSHWKLRGFRGVLAAWAGEQPVRIDGRTMRAGGGAQRESTNGSQPQDPALKLCMTSASEPQRQADP